MTRPLVSGMATVTPLFGDSDTEVIYVGTMRVVAGGSHTEVIVDDGKVIKIIAGKKKTMREQADADVLVAAMSGYRAALVGVGVLVPEILATNIQRNRDTGNYEIVMSCANAGRDLGDECNTADKAVAVAQDILRVIKQLLSITVPGQPHDVLVGIDPKPANFCRTPAGVVSFVDLMPPRFRLPSAVMIEYPEPTTALGQRLAYWRHFEQEGILVVLLSQLSRLCPLARESFVDLIMGSAAELGVTDGVLQHGAINFHAKPRDEKLQLIHELKSSDLYRGRNMACELVRGNSGFGKTGLDRIFIETHFDINDGFSDHQLMRLKIQLTRLANGLPPLQPE